jgi:hypothetical protein
MASRVKWKARELLLLAIVLGLGGYQVVFFALWASQGPWRMPGLITLVSMVVLGIDY